MCRQLFSAQALKYNDDQLLLHIRKLDDEIERWRLSIPNGFRPALFVSQNAFSNSPEEGIPHIIRRISLQLEYHHLMTVVHTTVRRYTPTLLMDRRSSCRSSFELRFISRGVAVNDLVSESSCQQNCRTSTSVSIVYYAPFFPAVEQMGEA